MNPIDLYLYDRRLADEKLLALYLDSLVNDNIDRVLVVDMQCNAINA